MHLTSMNYRAILLLILCSMFLIACDSVEEQQARLEHARAAYRQQQHRIRTAEAKEKLATWQGSLDSVSYAEFYRTDETLGPVVPSVEEVKISGKELEELLAIFRRAYPVPLPDEDILTNPGSEPLRINNDGEVEEDLFPLPEEPVLPDRFFAIDLLRLCDAQGNIIELPISLFGDIVPRTKAEQNRNRWTDRDRPLFMLEDADFKRYRSLPSYRLYVQHMKKAHSSGKWDLTPRFDELL